jgi:hypothetical protein
LSISPFFLNYKFNASNSLQFLETIKKEELSLLFENTFCDVNYLNSLIAFEDIFNSEKIKMNLILNFYN